MRTARNLLTRLFQGAIIGGSLSIFLRNCSVILGIALLAFTLLTVVFIFVQEGMLF